MAACIHLHTYVHTLLSYMFLHTVHIWCSLFLVACDMKELEVYVARQTNTHLSARPQLAHSLGSMLTQLPSRSQRRGNSDWPTRTLPLLSWTARQKFIIMHDSVHKYWDTTHQSTHALYVRMRLLRMYACIFHSICINQWITLTWRYVFSAISHSCSQSYSAHMHTLLMNAVH